MSARSNRRTSCEEDYRSPAWVETSPGYSSGSSAYVAPVVPDVPPVNEDPILTEDSDTIAI